MRELKRTETKFARAIAKMYKKGALDKEKARELGLKLKEVKSERQAISDVQ